MSDITSNFHTVIKIILAAFIGLLVSGITVSVYNYNLSHNKEIVSTKRLEPRIKLIVNDSNKIDTLYIYK